MFFYSITTLVVNRVYLKPSGSDGLRTSSPLDAKFAAVNAGSRAIQPGDFTYEEILARQVVAMSGGPFSMAGMGSLPQPHFGRTISIPRTMAGSHSARTGP